MFKVVLGKLIDEPGTFCDVDGKTTDVLGKIGCVFTEVEGNATAVLGKLIPVSIDVVGTPKEVLGRVEEI